MAERFFRWWRMRCARRWAAQHQFSARPADVARPVEDGSRPSVAA
ncbi:hypothetical protein [Blastococcus sp. SYSU DS0619]